MAEKSLRLDGNVVPSLYRLKITPDTKTFVFKGEVSITAKVKKPAKEITLNSSELRILSAHVIYGNEVLKAKPVLDRKRDTLSLKLQKSVDGSVEILIGFSGKHNDKMYGFYRSEYIYKGRKNCMLSTQFEAANARNTFPCFDEPAYKAAFEVSLLAGKGYECISNMPVKKRSADGNRQLWEFERTPIMSTYLLYMGVGRFIYKEGKAGRIRVRVYATPGHEEYLGLPLKYAIRGIKWLEGYFGIRYPLPKMDLIAIPDFAAGAMENWGAVTFKEIALLLKEDSPLPYKQTVAEVIIHEFAHQWFGDLVTMEWWDDIWLNESFATFMSVKAREALFPEWRIDIEHVVDTLGVAFSADEIKNTHPISTHIDSPAEMDSAFDEISYEKGGSVLSMLEDYCGEETFREGLRMYLKRYMYSNAARSDLWNAIDRAATSGGKRLQVNKVASIWITKKGYPYIKVRKDGKGGFGLEQDRFIFSWPKIRPDTWPIPITYAAEKERDGGRTLMDKKRAVIKDAGSWIKLNYGQRGLYRVFYDKEMLSRLSGLIKDKTLEWVDGWGLAEDLFVLARAGRINAAEYIEFAERFRDRCEYPMAISIMQHLVWMYKMLPEGHMLRGRINRLCIDYSDYHINRLGWTKKKSEPSTDTIMRSAAISLSGLVGNRMTIGRAKAIFERFRQSGTEIPSDVRGAVLKTVARNGGRDVYGWFKRAYIKEGMPDRKREYLACLGMFEDRKLALDALDFSLSKSVRYQDSLVVAAMVAGNPLNPLFSRSSKNLLKAEADSLIWEWTRGNWKELMRRYAIGTHKLGEYVSNLAVVKDRGEEAGIRKFFASKGNLRGDIARSYNDALERIELNIKFIEVNRQE